MTEHPDLEQWWPRLNASTQQWLVDNNGDAVPPEIQQEIRSVGGSLASEDWWAETGEPSGVYFSDAGIDWIEAAGNEEIPGS